MKKTQIAIIFISCFVGLMVVAIFAVGFLLPLIRPSEEFGPAEKAAAEIARKREPASTVITIKGFEHELPLPDGAAPYGEGFMICSDELRPYLENLPAMGYAFVEQMGSNYIYKINALNVWLEISTRQYTHSYYLIGFN